MDTKLKILVTGDVRGNFNQLFTKVNKINQKSGPFDILFCVGDFFGNSEDNEKLIAFKNGAKQVAVPTYILGPNMLEHVKYYENIENGEICTNLTYLGKRGLYTLSSGLKVVYLSGLEATPNAVGECYFNKDDIVAIRNSCLVSKNSASDYRGVDILLTTQQPFGIVEQNKNASKLISFLSKEIKPRYHFCSGVNGKFYEPAPFRLSADQITQLELCTRFISLGEVGNAKEKYIYALNLTPVEKMRVMELIQKTTNEIKCPYLNIDFSDCKVKNNSSDNKQYFFDMQSEHDNRKRQGGNNAQRHDKRAKFHGIEQDKCWFCLSSPNVEKHLVISVGDNFYLALAKGPINSYHVLIMSITHIQSAALLAEDDWLELTKFKNALKDFFEENGHAVCFTERNYKSSHLQINALGIEQKYAWKIEHTFEDKAEEYNLEFETLPALKSAQMLPPHGPYFVAELPNEKTLITRQMKHFPLHFARDVFCAENLLDCESKVNWKDCSLDKEEEIKMVNTFREKFKKYDFTI